MRRFMERRFTLVLLVLAQVTLLAVSSVAAVQRWVSLPLADGPYVLLVMGSDEGPPRSGSVMDGRADGIQLVVIDEEREYVSIVSFPRDSYVQVRGMGTTKINAMLTRGPENAVGTMEDLTGLTINDWVVTGFDAVILGVDEFDGVHVDVEQRLNNRLAGTDMNPGYQRLNGWRALGYMRDRGSRPDGDIGRSTAQATFLRALHQEIVDNASSPARLMDFIAIMRRHTESSLSTDQLIRLAVLALKIDPENVTQVTVPGRVGSAGAASVYRLGDGAFDIFRQLREDGRLAELTQRRDGG